MIKNLLTKHKIFIFEWLKEPSCVISAMKRAGYKGPNNNLEKKGHEILSHPDAQSITGKILNDKEIKEQVKLTIQKVLDDLEVAKKYSLQPYHDAQGNQRRELGVFVRATELQGKHLKMFADKVTVEVDGHAALVELVKKRLGENDG